MNESEEEERASGSASGIYRHIAIESEGAIFGSLPLKRVYEIEKMESKNGKRQCSRVKKALAGLRFSGQVREA
jgi:hypothetical protein